MGYLRGANIPGDAVVATRLSQIKYQGGLCMKNSEVIAYLHDHPEAKFKNLRMGGVIGYNECGELAWLEGIGSPRLFTIHYNGEPKTMKGGGNWDDNWELVQKPVPFMEAVKAFYAGKTIRCESDSWGKREYKRTDNTDSHMVDNCYASITAEEILDGVWSAED
jgi:hypothetical protein